MTLHATRAAALLSWVNSLRVADPVDAVPQLQDCSIFIKIVDSIHGTDEGQQILQQPVPERLDFVCSFLQKNRKHPSSPECLVSVQKVMEGSELELAKMTMLLLYHSTMSSKSPRDWDQFEYKIQVSSFASTPPSRPSLCFTPPSFVFLETAYVVLLKKLCYGSYSHSLLKVWKILKTTKKAIAIAKNLIPRDYC